MRIVAENGAAIDGAVRRYHPIVAAVAGAMVPIMVVFYLGVPDTTPEFADAAKLDAYLADRIGRVRERMGSKAP